VFGCRRVGLHDAEEVGALLDSFGEQRTAALIEPELVMVGVEAETKEEAIKQAVDSFTCRAAPTNRSPSRNQFGIARRYRPVLVMVLPSPTANQCGSRPFAGAVEAAPASAWDSLDGQPVSVVILLAIRESGAATEHMKVLARLARQLVHEEFRLRIEQENDPAVLCAFLRDQTETQS